MHAQTRHCLLALTLVVIAIPVAASGTPPAPAIRLHSADLASTASKIRRGDHLRVEAIEVPATSETLAFDVERFEVFAPGAEIVVHGRDGEHHLPAPKNVYLRGKVVDEPASHVFLEVQPGGRTRGIVSRAEDTAYLIDTDEETAPAPGGRAPLKAERADNALMKAQRGPWKCDQDLLPPTAANQLAELGISATAPSPPATGQVASATVAHTARVAIETDKEFYGLFNNVTAATNYVGNIIGYASSNTYIPELSTSLAVASVSLWTAGSDPWTQTGSTLCGLLEFGKYWNQNRTNVSRTIAHFMSGKPMGGGIAWLSVLCGGAFSSGAGASCPGLGAESTPWGGAYGFTASLQGNFNINTPNVMWDIMAVAHEIGHNFSSPHSHCYNNIGGNASPIDQCYSGENGCYSGPTSLPGPAGTHSGTLMSYCHLVQSSYADIALSFGASVPYGVQPQREQAKIQGYLNGFGNNACLAPAGGPTLLFADGFEGGGEAAWSVTVP